MIEVKNLSKRFRATVKRNSGRIQETGILGDEDWFPAVKDVSFRCAPGEILGLLGPNGAGKTTVLRILSTALKPDSGAAKINDIDIISNPIQARRQLGFLSGNTGLYGRLTVRENIEYFGRLHGLSPIEIKIRCGELFSQLEMNNFENRQVDKLSFGMKQKCAIARSVVHRPKAVILDEPTTGLDVMSAEILLDFIINYKNMGIPLVFSTHHLHEIDKLCDKVCVINRGQSVFFGMTSELKGLSNSATIYESFLNLVTKEV